MNMGRLAAAHQERISKEQPTMPRNSPNDDPISCRTMTTPVTRLLDCLAVPYRLLPHANPAVTCADAARKRGVAIEEMIKCLVLCDRATGRTVVACVPGDGRVSMSALKRIAGVKSFDTGQPRRYLQAHRL